MRIAKTQFPIFNPYGKSTFEIYVSGCNGHCKGCHNPELRDFTIGKEMDKWLLESIERKKDWIEVISFLGGEPLDQDEKELEKWVKHMRIWLPKEYWLFTRYEEPSAWVFELFDCVKVGEYREDLKQEGFPASSNQRLLRKGVDY